MGIWNQIKSAFSNNLKDVTKRYPAESDIPVSSGMGIYATRDVSISGAQLVQTDWDMRNAVLNGLKISDVIYSAFRVWNDAVVAVPFVVEVQNPKTKKWCRDDSHPLNALLTNPNPHFGRSEMMETHMSHLNMSGNGLTWICKDFSGVPGELWALNPTEVRVIPSANGYIQAYEYRPQTEGGVPIYLSPDCVIHTRLVDPLNPWWGMSPLQSAAVTAETDIAAINWNKNAMENRAEPNVVISSNINLSPRQFDEYADNMRKTMQGTINAKSPILTSSPATVTSLGRTMVEMDFLNTRKFNRENICAAFRTPVALILSDQTGGSMSNNVSPVYRFFWEQSVIPMMNRILESYNQRLVPFYRKNGDRLRVRADYSKVPAMATSLMDMIKTATLLSQMGVPFEEINQRLDLGFPEDMEMVEVAPTAVPARSSSADIDRSHLMEDNTPSGMTSGNSNSLPQSASSRGKVQ